MSEPGNVLEEAVHLLDTLRRQLGGGGRRPVESADDVWSRATHEEPVHHIATGAPECQYCPVCRAIVAAREARESHPGLADRAADVGRSLVDLVRATVAATDQPPTGRPEPTPTGFSTPTTTPSTGPTTTPSKDRDGRRDGQGAAPGEEETDPWR